MSAFNVVRMRVKSGHEQEYIDFHNSRRFEDLQGLVAIRVVKTGDRDFCFIGEWTGIDALSAARPKMIALLDTFRDRLEDLGHGLGITDPVSGEAVVDRHA